MQYAIGLDIGGTKVAAGLISKDGEIVSSYSVKSDVRDAETMYASVKTAISQVMSDASLGWESIEGIGAGVPGLVDSEKGLAIYQANIPWANFPVSKRLKEDFPVSNVVIDNDVRMAALAEWDEKKVSDEELFTYITISTGIASSFIQHKRFIRGAGFSGEVGQIPIVSPFDGEKKRLEEVVSGPGMERAYQLQTADSAITAKIMFENYQVATHYQEIIDGAAQAIAEKVYAIVALLDPHHIVFGGSVATNNPFFIELIKENMETWLLPDQKHILKDISISHFKQLSGLVGAGVSVFYTLD